MKIEIYFDGACRNVKDSVKELYGVGIAVFADREYVEELSYAYPGRDGTSNIAEWSGCVSAIEKAREIVELLRDENITPDITIYSDSQLVVKQFNGDYSIKEERFLKHYQVAKSIAEEFSFTKKIIWIPREENQKADDLSKIGLERARKEFFSWYFHDESDSIFIELTSLRDELTDLNKADNCRELGNCITGTREELEEITRKLSYIDSELINLVDFTSIQTKLSQC